MSKSSVRDVVVRVREEKMGRLWKAGININIPLKVRRNETKVSLSLGSMLAGRHCCVCGPWQRGRYRLEVERGGEGMGGLYEVFL